MIPRRQFCLALIIVLLLLITLTIGCSSLIEQGELLNPTTTPLSNASTKPFLNTLESRQTASPTITTVVETMVINTKEPSFTPLELATSIPPSTAVPTLSPDQALDTILDLYADNGGCQLPCWWGVIPGITSWEDAYSRLSQLGKVYGPLKNNSFSSFDFEFVVPTEIDPFSSEIDTFGYFTPAIWVNDDIVQGIGINSGWIRNGFDYSLAGWLGLLGLPDEIWLELYPESVSEPHYEMDLYYPSKGILVGISGNAQVESNIMTICPQELMQGRKFPPGILLWKPGEKVHYKSLGSEVFGDLLNWNPDTYYMLETLTTNFSKEDFYQTYLDNNSIDCFNIDISQVVP